MLMIMSVSLYFSSPTGGDDSRCSGCEHFFEIAFLVGFYDLVDCQSSLDDVVTFLFKELYYRVPCDSREDSAVQRSCNDLVTQHEERVGSTDLFDIFLFIAVQPQDLFESLLVSDLLSLQAACVVSAAFCFSCTAGSSSYINVFDIELSRSQTALVVRSVQD